MERKIMPGSYCDRKTREIKIADNTVQPGFPYGDVGVFYQYFGLSTYEIGTLVFRTHATVSRRLAKLGIPRRPVLKNPIFERKRLDGIKRVWEEDGPDISALIHTPENTSTRIAAIKKKYQTDPSYRERHRRNNNFKRNK